MTKNAQVNEQTPAHTHCLKATKLDPYSKYLYTACSCGALGGEPLDDEGLAYYSTLLSNY